MGMDNDKFNNYIDIDKDLYYEEKIIDRVEEAYREYDIYCDKMNRLKFDALSKASIAHIGQVVKSSLEKPIVGTQALDTCYGILFYDRHKKQAFCGHATPSSLVPTMYQMIKALGDKIRVVEYMIVPGFRNVDRGDYSGLDELNNCMMRYVPSNIKFKSFNSGYSKVVNLDDRTLSYEFAFDASTGEFVTSTLFFDETKNNPRYIPPKMRF